MLKLLHQQCSGVTDWEQSGALLPLTS